MISSIDKKGIVKIIENIAKAVEENKEYLTELDSKIGDGDHGVNLTRGFSSVVKKLPCLKNEDIHALLNTVGSTLLESVGGSVGILYGTAVMKAGEAVKGKEKIRLEDLVKMSEAAEREIKKRGHADVGDKTVLDTIHPFVETLREASEENLPLMCALERSVKAAKKGMESTKQMIAKKGRAKYFGKKTLGHQDVGATSCYLMMESMLKSLREIG